MKTQAKQKPKQEEYKETELGMLPENWQVVKLEEIANISSGGSAPQGKHYFNGENPFVRVQHIDNKDHVIRKYDLITEKAIKDYKLKLHPKGTIVFPKSGASVYLEKRAILPLDSYIVSHLCAVIPNHHDVTQNFLFYVLKSMKLAKEKADGYPTLNLSEVKKVKIPLPPLPEQKKIAYVLSTVQEAKEKSQNVINSLKELKRSMMEHVFGYGSVRYKDVQNIKQKETEAGTIPIGWEVAKLGELCDYKTGKLNSEAAKEYGKYPFFTCSQETYRIDSYSFDHEALLLAGNNARGIYSVKYYKGKFDAYQRTYVITVKDTRNVRYNYLLYELTRKLELLRKQSLGSTTKYLTAGIINNLDIAVPPIEDQERIGEILSSVDEKIEKEENKKNALEEMFKSMLRNLMTAKVRVNNLEVGNG